MFDYHIKNGVKNNTRRKIKAVLRCSLLVCVLFLLWTFSVAAAEPIEEEPKVVVDERTGVEYEISYRTNIYGSVMIYIDAFDTIDLEAIGSESSTNHSVSARDPRVVSIIADIREKLLKMGRINGDNDVCKEVWLSNGATASFDSASPIYAAFQDEISITFSGTKIVYKDDVPFTITGDGKGRFTIACKTDKVGYGKVVLVVPNTCKVVSDKEYLEETYTVTALNSDVGILCETFDSLDKALDYCAERGNSIYNINILAQHEYRLEYETEVGVAYYIYLEYGNRESLVDDTASSTTLAPTTSHTVNSDRTITTAPLTTIRSDATTVKATSKETDVSQTTVPSTHLTSVGTKDSTNVNHASELGNTAATSVDQKSEAVIKQGTDKRSGILSYVLIILCSLLVGCTIFIVWLLNKKRR